MLQTEETAQPSQIEQLSGAFDLFNRQSRQIEQAYEALKQRVAQIDAQLAAANQQLRSKVTELDRVSGYLQNILESVPSGVVAVDTDGRVTTFNRAAGQILAMEPGAAVGRHCSEVLRNGDGSPLPLLETLRTGQSVVEWRHELASPLGGPTRIVESTTSLVRDSSGRVQGAVEVFRDRTEIEELRQRLFRSDRLAQLGQAVAGVAHEIRNPLGGIEGFAALLERSLTSSDGSTDPDRRRRLVRNITQGVRNLNATVSSMLDFCRDHPIRPRPTRLSDVFGSLLDAVRAELEHRGQPQIEMTTDFEVDEIVADPEQLRQVGLNLVTNAVQSMEQGGRLTVSSRRSDDGSVQIAISDTGKGIEPDLLGRLFEPFVSGRPGGTGLGLAIVKKIVDQHGGRIDVSSQPVQGTTFTITLPAGSPQALGIAR